MKLEKIDHRVKRPTDLHFAFVASWASALQGSGDLAGCLGTLIRLLRADAAILARRHHGRDECAAIAMQSADAGRWPKRDLSPILADLVPDDMLLAARPASTWTLSEMGCEVGNAAAGHAPRPIGPSAMQDAAVVILDNDRNRLDYLGVRSHRYPQSHTFELLEHLAETMASCWRGRKIGLIRSYLDNSDMRPVLENDRQYVDILGYENPLDLTRCEFRVCVFLKNGLRIKSIAARLSVSEMTIRSHLSTIYSKLGVTGQVELLHLLNGGCGGNLDSHSVAA